MLCRVSHMTILSVVTCVVNVWNQSCQASVASLSPFCDNSCKLVDRPQDVRSSNSCQAQASQDRDSSSSCLNWWSSRQGLETLYSCSTFLFANFHNIAQRIFEHVLPCRTTTRRSLREAFPNLVIFELLQQKYWILSFLYIPQQWFHSVCTHVEYIQSIRDQEMKLVRQDINVFHQFLPHGSHILSLSSHFDVIHIYWQK